jgi:hypothetical protein
MHRSKRHNYSITSSAIASRPEGMARLKALIHGRYLVIHQEAVSAGVDDFAADPSQSMVPVISPNASQIAISFSGIAISFSVALRCL